MAAVLLEVDGSLVEEPLEGHVQRGVVRGPAAQHHALSHRHLHFAGAELHTHGVCKHKAAALSPQANPGRTPSNSYRHVTTPPQPGHKNNPKNKQI